MKQNTNQLILDVAQSMVRNRGYSAFSYADIAKEVGIRKASIHYHFPSKDDLVKQLVIRYRENLARQCLHIEQQNITPQEQMRKFVNLYRDGLQTNQMCLCGMLTADFFVLNPEIQAELKNFFQVTESWLAKLLKRGSEEKVWKESNSVDLEAKTIVAMLQGAQLVARASDNCVDVFDEIIEESLQDKLEIN